MENYLDFEELVHVVQHGLQEFIIKNIECESTKANDLSLYFVELGLLRK